MKYDKLTIIGLPKKFKVYYALDYLYPDGQLPDHPDDIIYDEWPADGEEGEDAMMVYEYYKSATGVYLDLGQVNVLGFFFLDLCHIEVGFAKILGRLELRAFLKIDAAEGAALRGRKVTGSLSGEPTGSHVGYLGGRNEVVHLLADGGTDL